jgi:hypothetical protein
MGNVLGLDDAKTTKFLSYKEKVINVAKDVKIDYLNRDDYTIGGSEFDDLNDMMKTITILHDYHPYLDGVTRLKIRLDNVYDDAVNLWIEAEKIFSKTTRGEVEQRIIKYIKIYLEDELKAIFEEEDNGVYNNE